MAALTAMEEVDGSSLEGGGQLLRVACALSVGFGRDVRITNIRARRSTPGLRPQHVASLKLTAALGGVALDADVGVGSTAVVVRGAAAKVGADAAFAADAGTAGAATLMLQAALPAAVTLRRGLRTTLSLRGGTNVAFSPSVDHARLVLAPNLARLGVRLDVACARRGFNPEGGGEVVATIDKPREIAPLTGCDAPAATAARVAGVVFGRGEVRATADAVAAALRAHLAAAFPGAAIDVRVDEGCAWATAAAAAGRAAGGRGRGKRARGPRSALGAQLALTSSSGATLGADFLEERRVRDADAAAAKTVAALARKFAAAGGGVDDQTADQLALFLALARGPSALRCPAPTCRHLETVAALAERLAGAAYATAVDGDTAVLRCGGAPSAA